jgi:hypothetical protein
MLFLFVHELTDRDTRLLWEGRHLARRERSRGREAEKEIREGGGEGWSNFLTFRPLRRPWLRLGAPRRPSVHLITLAMPAIGATAGSGTVGTGNTRNRACSQVEIMREMLPEEGLGYRSVHCTMCSLFFTFLGGNG